MKAGMDRGRKQGRRIGRPRVMDRKGFSRRFGDILERLSAGEISRRKASHELGIGYATLKRLIDGQEKANDGRLVSVATRRPCQGRETDSWRNPRIRPRIRHRSDVARLTPWRD